MRKYSVKYSGYWSQYSGYAEATRNDIVALNTVGMDVTTELSMKCNKQIDLGEGYQLCESLHGKNIDYKVKILHCTPDLYQRYLEPCKYHIGRLMWETDRLSPHWTWAANLCDEIWTATNYQKQVFIDSGVVKPVFVIPQAVDTKTKYNPFEIKSVNAHYDSCFLFYSIFQWIERKDWKTLLKAYWQEFGPDENVGLLIKTYKEFFAPEEVSQIIFEIKKLQKELAINRIPATYIYTQLLTKNNVMRLHATGDCYVSAAHLEGWGIPVVEAITQGKPVITAKGSGATEYFNDEFLPLETSLQPISGMEHIPWYQSNQKWTQVGLESLRKQMRYATTNRKEIKEMATKAEKKVEELFSFEAVGNRMKVRLGTIYKKIS